MAVEVVETPKRSAIAAAPSERAAGAAVSVATRRGRWSALRLSLIVFDTMALIAAFGIAYLIRFKAGLPLLDIPPYSGAFYSAVAVWSVPLWVVLLAAFRLYDRRLVFVGFDEYVRVANACTAGLVIQVMLSFLEVQTPVSRGWLLLTWFLSMLFVASGRFFVRRALRVLRRAGYFRVPTLIVGTNGEACAIAEQLLDDSAAEPLLLGFLDGSLPVGAPVLGGLQVVGSPERLEQVVERLGVRALIVASTAVTREQLLDLYRTVSQDDQVELCLSSGLFEILTTGMQVREFNSVPLMTPRRVRITGADAAMKAAVDYVATGTALVALSPIMALIAMLVWVDSGKPIIHRRRVLGVSGKTFDAFKFRTMILNAERRTSSQPIEFADRRLRLKTDTDPRVTRIGRFLRRTSLDELPQLWNVLRGEMSLVGPRMIAPDEWVRYGKWQHNLLTVKPGITGPWQIQGRGDIAYEERVRLSMEYIRNYSLWLDLAILLRTVWVVVQGRGAY